MDRQNEVIRRSRTFSRRFVNSMTHGIITLIARFLLLVPFVNSQQSSALSSWYMAEPQNENFTRINQILGRTRRDFGHTSQETSADFSSFDGRQRSLSKRRRRDKGRTKTKRCNRRRYTSEIRCYYSGI